MTPTRKQTATEKEVRQTVAANCPPQIVEMIATQLDTMRDCRKRIQNDGTIVADARGNPIQHPAIKLEADAQSRVNKLLVRWAAR